MKIQNFYILVLIIICFISLTESSSRKRSNKKSNLSLKAQKANTQLKMHAKQIAQTAQEGEETQEEGEEEEEEEEMEQNKIKLSTLEKNILSADLTDQEREKNFVYILQLKDKMSKILLEHAKREEKDKRFLVPATIPDKGIDPFTSYLGDLNVRAKDLQVDVREYEFQDYQRTFAHLIEVKGEEEDQAEKQAQEYEEELEAQGLPQNHLPDEVLEEEEGETTEEVGKTSEEQNDQEVAAKAAKVRLNKNKRRRLRK